MAMTITVPGSVAERARARLVKAQQVIDSFSELYDLMALLFNRAPPARDDEALAIGRAWLRASA
jgi:hypothetical protein